MMNCGLTMFNTSIQSVLLADGTLSIFQIEKINKLSIGLRYNSRKCVHELSVNPQLIIEIQSRINDLRKNKPIRS